MIAIGLVVSFGSLFSMDDIDHIQEVFKLEQAKKNYKRTACAHRCLVIGKKPCKEPLVLKGCDAQEFKHFWAQAVSLSQAEKDDLLDEFCAESFKLEVCKIAALVCAGAKEKQDKFFTMLEQAVVANAYDLVEYLLIHGKNTYKRQVFPVIHCAKTKAMAELLVGYGANVHEKNPRGETVLHHVGMDTKLTKYYLGVGVDPSQVDNDGDNPLHLLAQLCKDNFEVIENIAPMVLADKRVDPAAQNKNGQTAAQIAQKKINDEARPESIKPCQLLIEMIIKAEESRRSDGGIFYTQ